MRHGLKWSRRVGRKLSSNTDFSARPHFLRSEQVAEAGDIGVPLAEDLVGEAALADLVFDLDRTRRTSRPP